MQIWRREKCKRGHALTSENVRSIGGGTGRRCKVCERELARKNRGKYLLEKYAVAEAIELLKSRQTKGIASNVKTIYGIADIVTETHVYEVKRVLDMRAILSGVGQALFYGSALGKRPALAGPWHPDVAVAESLLDSVGITVLLIGNDTQVV